MNTAPEFFVPDATEDKNESAYISLAKFCGKPVPPLAERIYSVVFKHNGEVWYATVGQKLHGTKSTTRTIKGQAVNRSQSLGDPAQVLAIFPGIPYLVVTNHRIAGNVGSSWENPLLAGRPESVTRFSIAR